LFRRTQPPAPGGLPSAGPGAVAVGPARRDPRPQPAARAAPGARAALGRPACGGARRRGLRARPLRAGRRPLVKALVVIPAWNEAANLARVLDELRAARPDDDVLVVDDASVDATAELARGRGCRVLTLPLHLG